MVNKKTPLYKKDLIIKAKWLLLVAFAFIIGGIILSQTQDRSIDDVKKQTQSQQIQIEKQTNENTNEFAELSSKFPAEMDVPASKLISIACNMEALTSYQMFRSGSNVPLNKVRNFSLCSFDDAGQTSGIFLISEMGAQGSAEKNHVYLIDEYDIYSYLTNIDLGGHVCTELIKVTKDLIAYIGCGYGDGGGRTKQIIRLNLHNGEYQEIMNCTAYFPDLEYECEY